MPPQTGRGAGPITAELIEASKARRAALKRRKAALLAKRQGGGK